MKPYCSDHQGLDPVVAEIAAELGRREEEIRVAASSNGTALEIDVNGTVADDVLRVVVAYTDTGGCTYDRIMRSTNIPARAVGRYVTALKRAGRVTVANHSGKAPRVLYTGE
jgi:hypothetical protein